MTAGLRIHVGNLHPTLCAYCQRLSRTYYDLLGRAQRLVFRLMSKLRIVPITAQHGEIPCLTCPIYECVRALPA